MKGKFVKENLNESDLDWFEGDNEKHDPNDWEDEYGKDRPGLVRELTALFEEAAQIGYSLEELQEVCNAALNEVDWEEINNYKNRHKEQQEPRRDFYKVQHANKELEEEHKQHERSSDSEIYGDGPGGQF